MSKAQPKRKTYLMFRRYVSAITMVCVIVTIIAGVRAEVSFPWITVRALLVWFGIFLLQRMLLATWSSWEVTHGSESNKSRS